MKGAGADAGCAGARRSTGQGLAPRECRGLRRRWRIEQAWLFARTAYDTACSAARKGGLTRVRDATFGGRHANAAHASRDSDLPTLRTDPRWPQRQRFKTNAAKAQPPGAAKPAAPGRREGVVMSRLSEEVGATRRRSLEGVEGVPAIENRLLASGAKDYSRHTVLEWRLKNCSAAARRRIAGFAAATWGFRLGGNDTSGWPNLFAACASARMTFRSRFNWSACSSSALRTCRTKGKEPIIAAGFMTPDRRARIP